MSRKWAPATETARDKLQEQLMFSGLSPADRWRLIDDFAHALAEQQRDWADDSLEFGNPTGMTPEMLPGVRWGADLIDPEV